MKNWLMHAWSYSIEMGLVMLWLVGLGVLVGVWVWIT